MRAVAVAVAVGLALAGCDGGGEGSNGAGQANGGTASDEAAGKTIDVRAFDYRFEMPTEVQGGVVLLTLDNRGEEAHEAMVLSLGDTSAADALTDLDKLEQVNAPLPASFEFAGGIAAIRPNIKTATTLSLPPGRYLLVCTLVATRGQVPPEGKGIATQHFEAGQAREFTAVGNNNVPLPEADGVLVGRDYAFDVPALAAGRRELLFRNTGPDQVHQATVYEFPEGVDEAAARQAIDALLQSQQAGGPPPAGTPSPTPAGTSGTFAPGRAGTFTVGLVKGRTYAVLCFLRDRQGGPPHALARAMVSTFRAS